jgi:hypothetical protein
MAFVQVGTLQALPSLTADMFFFFIAVQRCFLATSPADQDLLA